MKNLFSKVSSPYYIYAPDYRRTSAGVRVMHMLCDALNRCGHEAYIAGTTIINPALNTPVLNDAIKAKHKIIDAEPIVVYPEVVFGNPLEAKFVVRYLLNRPGFLGGGGYSDDDLIFSYTKALVPPGADVNHVLFLPATDLGVFNQNSNGTQRIPGRVCYYLGRNRQGSIDQALIGIDAIEITQSWPSSWEAMADVFSQCEIFYSCEASGLVWEAALCGCLGVVIPGVYAEKPLASEEVGMFGIAWGCAEDELERARRTLPLAFERAKNNEKEFWSQLECFIDVTQDEVQRRHGVRADKIDWNLVFNQGDNHSIVRSGGQSVFCDKNIYSAWLSNAEMRFAERQGLVRRFNGNGLSICFDLFIQCGESEFSLLADTLDSIGEQSYGNWRIFVMSDASCPDPIFDGKQLFWIGGVDVSDGERLRQVQDSILSDYPENWFAQVQVGTRFSLDWLFVVVNYIQNSPDKLAFYCDHDFVSASGEHSRPVFKPCFDPDYLYASDYIGSAVLLRTDKVLAVGGVGSAGAWAHVDVMLRLFERHGVAYVGNISKILISLSDLYQVPVGSDIQVRKLINRAHFERINRAAIIKSGLVDGTLRVEYQHEHKPLVSIVVPNWNMFEYLQPCIESVIGKTAWLNWELIVVDNGSDDPDVLSYYHELRERLGGRFSLVSYDAPFNFAAQCNIGVEMACGDYVLFLNNDTQMIQPSWLDRMMSHAMRPEVGIVGCRLVYPESGKLQHVGLAFNSEAQNHNIIVHPFNSADGDDYGYMNLAFVERNCSVVSSACMLVRKSVYQQVTGFDQINLPLAFGHIDFSFKVEELGLRTIFTPFASVVHHGSASLNVKRSDLQWVAKRALIVEDERRYLFGKWLARMAHDPFMNQHIVCRGHALKLQDLLPVTWDVAFHDVPRIYGFGDGGGSGRYRIGQPLAALEQAGGATVMMALATPVVRLPGLIQAKRMEADVFLMQAPVTDHHFECLELYQAFLPGMRRIAQLDDLMTAIPEESNVYKDFMRNFRDMRSRLRKGLALCDRLIVSTEALREFYKDYISDIRVVPNRLRRCEWDGLNSLRGQGKKPRVGWVGAHQHAGDLALIREVVLALADEVEWVFMGMTPEGLNGVSIEFHSAVPYEQYPQKMASLNLDLALAPLVDNDFNRCKSNLRLLEYGAMRWPVVCSDVEPYRTYNAPVVRVADDAMDWIAAIRKLVASPELGRKEGERLRAWVDKHYWMDDYWREWEIALLK